MARKITLKLSHEAGGGSVACKQPSEDSDHVVAPGACPFCAANPFAVGGSGMHPSVDDLAYEADAGCMACRAYLGELRVEMNTLFGVREDEAVLRGRCRVY